MATDEGRQGSPSPLFARGFLLFVHVRSPNASCVSLRLLFFLVKFRSRRPSLRSFVTSINPDNDQSILLLAFCGVPWLNRDPRRNRYSIPTDFSIPYLSWFLSTSHRTTFPFFLLSPSRFLSFLIIFPLLYIFTKSIRMVTKWLRILSVPPNVKDRCQPNITANLSSEMQVSRNVQ